MFPTLLDHEERFLPGKEKSVASVSKGINHSATQQTLDKLLLFIGRRLGSELTALNKIEKVSALSNAEKIPALMMLSVKSEVI